jgi:cytochrome c553
MRTVLILLLGGASAVALAFPVKHAEFARVLERKPEIANGAKLYETCVACHGAKGEGVSDGSVPSLGGQAFEVIAKQIVDFRIGERKDERMAHFTDTRHLAYSQHVADVAAFIATLAAPKAKPAPSTARGGAAIYARACERCHGSGGVGVEGSLVPRIAGQHYEYLVKQLDITVENLRPEMVKAHEETLRAVSKGERASVAAYLTSTGE